MQYDMKYKLMTGRKYFKINMLTKRYNSQYLMEYTQNNQTKNEKYKL